MGYEVITAAENTGLDGVVFATKKEATEAMQTVNKMFTDAKFDVVETDEPANMTYAEWNEGGW